MKRWNRQLVSIGMIVVAIAGVGCASPTPYEPPPMPPFETEHQMAAGQECKAVYSCCARSCSDARVASNEPAAHNDKCLAACGSSLEECYRACE